MSTWGFGVGATEFDDIYHVDLLDDENQYQYMDIEGKAGNDTFNIEPSSRRWGGGVGIGYWGAPGGVKVDLVAGTAEDGYGGIDTINGDVAWVYGSPHADRLLGSDNNEEFRGTGGDDVIDGGGGFDWLSFSSAARANSITADLKEGSATGSRYGESFTYTISNIEAVAGGNETDFFLGSDRDEMFRGRGGDDLFFLEGRHGNDTITDFHEGDNTIILLDMDVTKSQVLGAATDNGDGGSWIDLRPYGGGTITLQGVSPDALDASNFLL